MNPVGEPDAGKPHVRFDERRPETEPWNRLRHPQRAKATGNSYFLLLQPPRRSSTLPGFRSETVEKAVVADFVEAAWQDMHNEAVQEFFAARPHAASLAIAPVLDADVYVCGVHGFDARVAKRNTKHVTAEIVEHGLGIHAAGFAECVPTLGPGGFGQRGVDLGIALLNVHAHSSTYRGAERLNGQQKAFVLGPLLMLAILHNFPIIGYFRYWQEAVGPEVRQYIVTSNDEERLLSRDQRVWI